MTNESADAQDEQHPADDAAGQPGGEAAAADKKLVGDEAVQASAAADGSQPEKAEGGLGFGWRLLITAAVVFIAMDTLSPHFTTQLREISSIIAEHLMTFVGFDIERTGNVLFAPQSGMKFEVVEACSGSTTLTVLICLGIVWCGSHPGLDPLRRVIAVLLSVPVAVISNGLRVSLLVVLGDLQMQAIEGIPHVIVGLITFCLAMGTVFLYTEMMSTRVKGKRDNGPLMLVIGLLLSIFLMFIPLASWSFQTWGNSPLDHHGYIFLGISIAVLLWYLIVLPGPQVGGDAEHANANAAQRFRPACALLGVLLSVLVVLLAARVDIRSLNGLAAIGMATSLLLYFKGWRVAIFAFPVVLIGWLGAPVVAFKLNSILGLSGKTAALAVKSVLTLVALGVSLGALQPWRYKAGKGERFDLRHRQVLTMMLAVCICGFALLSYFKTRGAAAVVPTRLEMSYIQGDWVGHEMDSSKWEGALGGSVTYHSRMYVKDREGVNLLVTNTGGDRHQAHPPQYCLTGGGWVIDKEEVVEMSLGGKSLPVTRMLLSRDGRQLSFCYWFSDGEVHHGKYDSMLVQDGYRRAVEGRQTDWYLYRVMATSGDALESFVAAFESQIVEVKSTEQADPVTTIEPNT